MARNRCCGAVPGLEEVSLAQNWSWPHWALARPLGGADGDWWWGGGKCKNKVKQNKNIFDPPVSVLFRAMFHGIDQSQNGVRKFFNFFHQDED